MKKVNNSSKPCSLAKSLDILGEWWTLPILQEALLGTNKFNEFYEHLGIAKNILTIRLNKLVNEGILEKKLVAPYGKRTQYVLTQKGLSTATIIIALIQWCDKWVLSADEIPMELRDKSTKQKISKIKLEIENGRKVNIWDIITTPGPGATEEIRYRFK